MKKEHLIIEALLFVAPDTLSAAKVAEILKIETKEAIRLIEEYGELLKQKESALQLVKLIDGYKLGTRPEYYEYVNMLITPRETKLSYQALETLSIIAFKQPITKNEIEKIRGINSDGIISMLHTRGLIKVVGYKKISGNPKLYGLSKDFFKYFGIKNMSELKSYFKSIQIDTSKLDELLNENREEGVNVLFYDQDQSTFEFDESPNENQTSKIQFENEETKIQSEP